MVRIRIAVPGVITCTANRSDDNRSALCRRFCIAVIEIQIVYGTCADYRVKESARAGGNTPVHTVNRRAIAVKDSLERSRSIINGSDTREYIRSGRRSGFPL